MYMQAQLLLQKGFHKKKSENGDNPPFVECNIEMLAIAPRQPRQF